MNEDLKDGLRILALQVTFIYKFWRQIFPASFLSEVKCRIYFFSHAFYKSHFMILGWIGYFSQDLDAILSYFISNISLRKGTQSFNQRNFGY